MNVEVRSKLEEFLEYLMMSRDIPEGISFGWTGPGRLIGITFKNGSHLSGIHQWVDRISEYAMERSIDPRAYLRFRYEPYSYRDGVYVFAEDAPFNGHTKVRLYGPHPYLLDKNVIVPATIITEDGSRYFGTGANDVDSAVDLYLMVRSKYQLCRNTEQGDIRDFTNVFFRCIPEEYREDVLKKIHLHGYTNVTIEA